MAISFPLSPNTGDQFNSGSRNWVWDGSAWNLDSDWVTSVPKVYVEQFSSPADTWVVPAGVTQIKLTLIGAGGSSGDATAIVDTAYQAGSASFSSFGDGNDTTFTAGMQMIVAAGGKKGIDVSDTTDSFKMAGSMGLLSANTSSFTGPTLIDQNRYPGCGGTPATAGAQCVAIFDDGVDEFVFVTNIAFARSLRGQDGVTVVQQLTVTPGDTHNFYVGTAGGYVPGEPIFSGMGSNGAVIIEYVL